MSEEQWCTECGMEQAEWRGNAGQGYVLDDEQYCCQGCAEGTGCTCAEPELEPGQPSSLTRAFKRESPHPEGQERGAFEY